VQLDALSLVVVQEDKFFDSADTEDTMGIDDIFTAQSYQVL
jgi:hypothetical protein